MKAGTTLPVIFCFVFSAWSHDPLRTVCSEKYALAANAWAKTAFAALSVAEADEVLEVLRCSYERSVATLETQRIVVDALLAAWKRWENVTAVRMNPSRKMPCVLDEKEQDYVSAVDAICLDYHTRMEEYAACVNRATSKYNSSAFQKVIKEIRTKAREEMVSSLVASLADIERMLERVRAGVAQAADSFAHHQKMRSSSSWWNYLTDLLPAAYFMKTFIRFEDDYIAVSNNCFHALHASQEVSITLWELIESTRASFYKAYYQAWHQVCMEHCGNMAY